MADTVFLLLENGQLFEGYGFGATGSVTGEVVFTTGMTGYLETLTDPSYFGQIVMMTFPLIGNYGVIPQDFESEGSVVKAFIVRECCDEPSNFRAQGTLDKFLKEQNIIGLYGLDTRRLTRIIRESGVMNARIIPASAPEAKLLQSNKQSLLDEIKSYRVQNAVKSVTCAKAFTTEPITVSPIVDKNGKRNWAPIKPPVKSAKTTKRVVLWDFGAKANICRELARRNLQVVTMPANASAQDILAQKPDGIMLSNGPGDPVENVTIIEELKKLVEHKIPTFGICLGHQLLALATGAKTQKLKYGHRGANQPVRNVQNGRVVITSQNHGYAVVTNSLPSCAQLSYVNTNDETCEGIKYPALNAFSVQFHPEASSGPLDTGFLFDEFVDLIEKNVQ